MSAHTLVGLVIRVLRDLSERDGFTDDELQGAFNNAIEGAVAPPGYAQDLDLVWSRGPHQLTYALDLLPELEALGLAEKAEAEGNRWRLAKVWPKRPIQGPVDQGDGDGGGDGPSGGDGDDGAGGGGGGIAQVLAHPYLFTVSDAEFDRALNRALETK